MIAIASAAMALVAAASAQEPAGRQAYPVGYGTKAVDAHRDPWLVVTDATVAPLLLPKQRRVHRTRRVSVDYDADGVPDVAWMVFNRTQIGVLVRYGVSGRVILAYRSDGRWSDQSLHRIGRRAIGIEFPESTVVTLSSESGRPMVYFAAEGG